MLRQTEKDLCDQQEMNKQSRKSIPRTDDP